MLSFTILSAILIQALNDREVAVEMNLDWKDLGEPVFLVGLSNVSDEPITFPEYSGTWYWQDINEESVGEGDTDPGQPTWEYPFNLELGTHNKSVPYIVPEKVIQPGWGYMGLLTYEYCRNVPSVFPPPEGPEQIIYLNSEPKAFKKYTERFVDPETFEIIEEKLCIMRSVYIQRSHVVIPRDYQWLFEDDGENGYPGGN